MSTNGQSNRPIIETARENNAKAQAAGTHYNLEDVDLEDYDDHDFATLAAQLRRGAYSLLAIAESLAGNIGGWHDLEEAKRTIAELEEHVDGEAFGVINMPNGPITTHTEVDAARLHAAWLAAFGSAPKP